MGPPCSHPVLELTPSLFGMCPHFVEHNGALFFSVICTVAPSLPPLYRGDISRIILFLGATICVTPFTEHNARYLLLLLLRDVLVAPFLSLCPPPFCILGDIIRIFFGATICIYTALVWLPRYSLLLPDDGQVSKRCKNNGTGSDVMCSSMRMGVSTRILFTDEAAGSLSPSLNNIEHGINSRTIYSTNSLCNTRTLCP